TLTISTPMLAEGSGGGTTTVTFDVVSPLAVQGGFSVAFSAANISAIAGSDYTVLTASPLHFTGAANEKQTVSVNITKDDLVESDEKFKLTLGAISGTTAVQQAAITSGG